MIDDKYMIFVMYVMHFCGKNTIKNFYLIKILGNGLEVRQMFGAKKKFILQFHRNDFLTFLSCGSILEFMYNLLGHI